MEYIEVLDSSRNYELECDTYVKRLDIKECIRITKIGLLLNS